MKVHEYLKFCAGLKSVPISKRKQQVEYVMERLKVTDVQNRLIKNLSKGYKQRVGFAQALLGDPKFLILDEPTVGLDPNQVVEVREIIRELKKTTPLSSVPIFSAKSVPSATESLSSTRAKSRLSTLSKILKAPSTQTSSSISRLTAIKNQ